MASLGYFHATSRVLRERHSALFGQALANQLVVDFLLLQGHFGGRSALVGTSGVFLGR
jgi:hypothetical protein